MPRAYEFTFTSHNGETVRVIIDLLIHKGISLGQATMDAITAVLEIKGSGWIKDYSTREIS